MRWTLSDIFGLLLMAILAPVLVLGFLCGKIFDAVVARKFL